jgi:hypothetical protein
MADTQGATPHPGKPVTVAVVVVNSTDSTVLAVPPLSAKSIIIAALAIVEHKAMIDAATVNTLKLSFFMSTLPS